MGEEKEVTLVKRSSLLDFSLHSNGFKSQSYAHFRVNLCLIKPSISLPLYKQFSKASHYSINYFSVCMQLNI